MFHKSKVKIHLREWIGNINIQTLQVAFLLSNSILSLDLKYVFCFNKIQAKMQNIGHF